jgi:NADPH:quinone reductase-like Zn-dependent oxidoreductase
VAVPRSGKSARSQIVDTMKAVRIHSRAGAEGLVYEDAPQPQTGPNELLVRVHAAAVTPTELEWAPTWTTRNGAPRPFPIIPGHEFSGVVAALGPGVGDPPVGTAVYGLNDWFGDGADAEFTLARSEDLAPVPRSVDHVQAAVVPISGLTAWQGLFERAKLARGQRVLIHGAAGAVGSFAVQLAHWRGAQVVATAHGRHVDFLRGLGVAQVIDYTTARFEEIVHDLDVVFDTIGGDTLARSWRVLRPGGTLVTIAAQSERETDARVRDAFFIVTPSRTQLTELAQLIDAGTLRPIVAGVLPLANAREAYAGRRDAPGKTVLRVVA